jgi:hypothetical protein
MSGAGRGDPGPTLLRVEAGEDTHLAGDQKAQRVDRLPNPPGIRHDGDALQSPRVVDADVEIIPSGARETRTDFVIQPDLAVPLERCLHRRPQHAVALFVSDPSGRDDTDDVVGQLFDDLDHEAPLFNINFIDFDTRRPGPADIVITPGRQIRS